MVKLTPGPFNTVRTLQPRVVWAITKKKRVKANVPMKITKMINSTKMINWTKIGKVAKMVQDS